MNRDKHGGFNCPNNPAHDEFEVYPTGYEIGIVVNRDGSTCNMWADGTVGVTGPDFAATLDETDAVCHACGAEVSWRE